MNTKRIPRPKRVIMREYTARMDERRFAAAVLRQPLTTEVEQSLASASASARKAQSANFLEKFRAKTVSA